MVAATKGRYQICQLLLEHGAVVGIPPEAKVATKVHSCLELQREDGFFREKLPHPSPWHADRVEWMWLTFCWNMVPTYMQGARYVGGREGGKEVQFIHSFPHQQNGMTAMHICCQEGHLDVVKVLQSHGASLGATSKVSHMQ